MFGALPFVTNPDSKKTGLDAPPAATCSAISRHGCGVVRSNGTMIKHASAKPAAIRLRHFTLPARLPLPAAMRTRRSRRNVPRVENRMRPRWTRGHMIPAGSIQAPSRLNWSRRDQISRVAPNTNQAAPSCSKGCRNFYRRVDIRTAVPIQSSQWPEIIVSLCAQQHRQRTGRTAPRDAPSRAMPMISRLRVLDRAEHRAVPPRWTGCRPCGCMASRLPRHRTHREARARTLADSPQASRVARERAPEHRVHSRRVREHDRQWVECPQRRRRERHAVVEHLASEREYQRECRQRKHYRHRAQRDFTQPENPRVKVKRRMVEQTVFPARTVPASARLRRYSALPPTMR